MTRSKRLTGQGTSPLLQVWTTVRLRVLLRATANKCDVSQSEFVRAAIWERIQATLSPAEVKRLDREAALEAAKQGKRE